MSDCSTNDMKAKERPKTCGTCGHSAKRHDPPTNVGAPRKNDLVCLVHAVGVSSEDSGAPMPCGIYHQEPGNWTPRTDTLEQRCQQLEQVAREMYLWFGQFLLNWENDYGLGPIPKSEMKYDKEYFRKRLEALGVRVDD